MDFDEFIDGLAISSLLIAMQSARFLDMQKHCIFYHTFQHSFSKGFHEILHSTEPLSPMLWTVQDFG